MRNPAAKLPIYDVAMEFALSLDDFVETFPPYRRYLGLQLRRAALSILLNLTEGATEIEPMEKARMYRQSRRSAAECATGLDFGGRVMPSHREAAKSLELRALGLTTQLHHLIRAHRNNARTTRKMLKPRVKKPRREKPRSDNNR